MARNQHHATLGVISLGVALGVTSAIFVVLLGLFAAMTDWGVPIVAILSTVYLGYAPTLVGIVAGAVWAFADGFIAGVMIAWLYNRFLLMRQHPTK